MSKNSIAIGAVFALFLCPWLTYAKDFPEPVLVADPLAAASMRGSPAGMGGALEYGNYIAAHDDVDSFYLRLSASPVIIDLGGAFALGAVYESVLMCGPVSTGDTPADIVAFWMNAVQFEYGLYASLALPGPGTRHAHLLAEYSRTSQHPIREQYSEVASDILTLGLALGGLSTGSLRASSYIRAGYCDLFGFWQSPLPKPRESWILKPAVETELHLKGGMFAVARAYPEIFIDRYTNEIDGDFFAETGVTFEKGLESEEILLTFYGTHDSEMLRAKAHPTFEAGIAVRFSHRRASGSGE